MCDCVSRGLLASVRVRGRRIVHTQHREGPQSAGGAASRYMVPSVSPPEASLLSFSESSQHAVAVCTASRGLGWTTLALSAVPKEARRLPRKRSSGFQGLGRLVST